MTEPMGEDEFTELVDAQIPRVDLVGKGANGLPFLIAKADQAGVFPADVVRGLVAKAGGDVSLQRDDVTITGSPGAVAKMIHDAAQRAVVADDNGKADGSMSDEITKADAPELDEPLPDADETAEDEGLTPADGDPDDPSSAAWEAVDAARAGQAIELTLALRRLVCEAQSREAQEAATPTGDPQDAEAVWDLDGVLCAIDCILSILAPFQVNEQAESADRQAERDQLTKGLVRKAGRVLSSVNEQRIRNAEGLLQEVLASLPAPTDDSGDQVAKSEPEEADVAKAGTMTVELVVDASSVDQAVETIEKAKGDPQVAVYTADGKLVGTVDQADLNPIAAPAAPEGGDEQGGDDTAASGGDETASGGDAGTEAAPAAPADTGQARGDQSAVVPGTDTVQQPADNAEDGEMQKGDQSELIKAAVEPLMAEIQVLKERLEQVAASPAPGGPRLNGATGAAGLAARTPDQEDEVEALRKAADAESDPKRKEELSYAAAFAAVKKAQTGKGPHIGAAPVNAEAVLKRFLPR